MTKPEAKPAPLMLARIPNTRHGAAVLAGIREFLNRDGYKLAVEFSGPRHRYTEGGHLSYGTKKENATAFRLYVTRKHAPIANNDYAELLRTQDALTNARIDAARHITHVAELEHFLSVERCRTSTLEHKLLVEVERAVTAENHAIDQDRENEALLREVIKVRDELNAIPRWVRALFDWMQRNQICQPDPRG